MPILKREKFKLGHYPPLGSLKNNVELFALAPLGPSRDRPAISVGPGDPLLARLGPARNQVVCQVFSRSQEDAARGLRGRNDGLNSRLGVGQRTAGLIWQL